VCVCAGVGVSIVAGFRLLLDNRRAVPANQRSPAAHGIIGSPAAAAEWNERDLAQWL
jgi:hypothetical protein